MKYLLIAIPLMTNLVFAIESSGEEQEAKVETVDAEKSEKSVSQIREKKLVISAYRDPFMSQAPESVAAVNLEMKDAVVPPKSILGFIEATPGVSSNGQGGIFQTYSIRGVAKHRVKTLVDGIPIVAERRAGVSASFIDPQLIESLDIVRGPVSTFYGTGALGGAVNVFLAQPTHSRVDFGFETQGQGNSIAGLWVQDHSVIGFSNRAVNNSEAANGSELHDQFNLSNLYVQHQWRDEQLDYSFWWLESYAKDIGKSNTRYPDSRITVYPHEKHTMVKFSAKSDNGWLFETYVHPNELITDNVRVGSRLNSTHNKSTDLGASFQQQIFEKEQSSLQWGLDWFSRKNVDAFETETSFSSGQLTESRIFDNGRLDDVALFLSSNVSSDSTHWHLGARINAQQQSVQGSPALNDSEFSSFVGMEWSFAPHWSLTSNLATGFRFPTLSERFFTGSTARADIIAAESLKTERSLNKDLALHYKSGGHKVSWQHFSMKVEDYIERVTLNDGSQTYTNLTEGDIRGDELSYQYQNQAHQLGSFYTRYRGTGINRAPDGSLSRTYLSDIPAQTLNLNYQWAMLDSSIRVNWLHRREKTEFGDGELPSRSFNLVSLGYRHQLSMRWSASVAINNVFDQLYIASNDDLDTWATGRNISLNLRWND